MPSYFGGKLLNGSDARGSVGTFFPDGDERPSATTNNTEKFATYYRDSESGLDYAQNRYHQPGGGRFMSPDPYQASGGPSDPGSWNRYAYAGGDPANRADPGGLEYCAFDACVWANATSSSTGAGWNDSRGSDNGSCDGNSRAADVIAACADEGINGGDGGFAPAPPPDPCSDIGDSIETQINGERSTGTKEFKGIAQRYKQAQRMKPGRDDALGGYVEAFVNTQRFLIKLLKKWDDDDCGPHQPAWDEWATKPAPTGYNPVIQNFTELLRESQRLARQGDVVGAAAAAASAAALAGEWLGIGTLAF